MTKIVFSDWDTPERRIGRTTRPFRLVWGAFCWTLAYAAVAVASTAFLRWHHLL
jgi:hypothetical protein